MKVFFKFILVSLNSILFFQEINALCIIYQKENQLGYRLILRHNNHIPDFGVFDTKTEFRKNIDGKWIGAPDSFNNQASSIYVKSGCLLDLYSNVNETGIRIAFHTYLNEDIRANLASYGFADVVSSASCYCKY